MIRVRTKLIRDKVLRKPNPLIQIDSSAHNSLPSFKKSKNFWICLISVTKKSKERRVIWLKRQT